MLELKDVRKSYRMGSENVEALRGVTLKIQEGDFVAIMGPSGSGKSTLMHVLGLLDTPTSGSYKIRDREVAHYTEDELAILRRQTVGFIFQQFHLLPRLTAVENVALPLLYSRGTLEVLPAAQRLAQVALQDRIKHRPNELSGGQQQRVAIARSLVNEPLILLADEPTGNLDSVSEAEILRILKELNQQGMTLLVVTHEEDVGAMAKRRIRMKDGQIVSDERLAPVEKNISLPIETQAARGAPFLSDLTEHFRQGFKTLAGNKIRSLLSMLGILIGVAAVVVMLALGKGAQQMIEKQLSSLGSNLLVLRSGASRMGGVSAEATTRLDLDDAVTVEKQITGIREVSPVVAGRAQVARGDKNWSTQLLGVLPSYARMHSVEPEVGRFITSEENQSRSLVAVLGVRVVQEIFGSENPLGQFVKINRVNFQVVGLLPEKGASSFRDQDDLVLVPLNTAMKRLLGKQNVDYIDIEATDASVLDQAQDSILKLMLSRHRVPLSQGQDAFSIRNMADIQNALAESSKTMSLLLAAIAAISLLVGGIGIMNIMLVSVTERTREIGLRKAVGARKKDILSQFLAESILVSSVGGVLGVLLAWAVTFVISWSLGWTTSISLSSVIGSFLFSATIGILFGSYPAKKASELNPIDALRSE